MSFNTALEVSLGFEMLNGMVSSLQDLADSGGVETLLSTQNGTQNGTDLEKYKELVDKLDEYVEISNGEKQSAAHPEIGRRLAESSPCFHRNPHNISAHVYLVQTKFCVQCSM